MGAMTQTKVLAMKTISQGMSGQDFQQFLQEELAPRFWKGAVVVMDNLPAHKVKSVIKIKTNHGLLNAMKQTKKKTTIYVTLFKAWISS